MVEDDDDDCGGDQAVRDLKVLHSSRGKKSGPPMEADISDNRYLFVTKSNQSQIDF